MSESFLLTKIKKGLEKVSTKWKPEYFKKGKKTEQCWMQECFV